MPHVKFNCSDITTTVLDVISATITQISVNKYNEHFRVQLYDYFQDSRSFTDKKFQDFSTTFYWTVKTFFQGFSELTND